MLSSRKKSDKFVAKTNFELVIVQVDAKRGIQISSTLLIISESHLLLVIISPPKPINVTGEMERFFEFELRRILSGKTGKESER